MAVAPVVVAALVVALVTGGGSFGRNISVYHSWLFDEYFTAHYAEQKSIKLLKNYGYKQIRSDDWFEIDRSEIDAAIRLIVEFERSVADWGLNNRYAGSSVPRITPPFLIRS